jgi:hypothetical protein
MGDGGPQGIAQIAAGIYPVCEMSRTLPSGDRRVQHARCAANLELDLQLLELGGLGERV